MCKCHQDYTVRIYYIPTLLMIHYTLYILYIYFFEYRRNSELIWYNEMINSLFYRIVYRICCSENFISISGLTLSQTNILLKSLKNMTSQLKALIKDINQFARMGRWYEPNRFIFFICTHIYCLYGWLVWGGVNATYVAVHCCIIMCVWWRKQ